MPLLALLGLLIGAQTQTASVSGRVTDRATGQPIPRMVVAAFGSDRKTAGEALTDADGRYEIAGLRPGDYGVSVTHDEHRSTYLRQWFGEDGPSNFGVPRRFGIRLNAGDRRIDVDVALTRALAIEGVVLDPEGDPIAQVEINALSAAGGVIGRPVYTDDRGAYRVYGLLPGRYRVCARPSAGPITGDPTGRLRTCHPAAITEADASDVSLTSQDASGIDIRLQRTGTRSVSGTVVDASGAPADRANVNVLPVDDSGGGGSTHMQKGPSFTVKGLTPGRYVVVASVGGSNPGDPDPPSRERESAYAPVDLTVGDASLALTLSRAVTVGGSVTFEGNAPPKSGLPRLTVQTMVSTDLVRPWSMSQPASAAVRSDFTFELGDVFRMPLRVFLRGLPDGWLLKSVRYGDRDITYAATDLSASPGTRLQLIVTDKVASPLVKVVNERGEETPASQVIAMPADPSRWAPPFVRYPTGPSTSAGAKLGVMLPGDYLFAALPLEDFSLVMRDPSRLPSVAAVATKVSLEAGDTRLLTLRLVTLPGR
jgi:Carboxypeptidase regulatory-like domain